MPAARPASAGNVTTSGVQTYNDNVTVTSAATLSTTNSAITFGGTVTLSGNLIANAGTGNFGFAGAVNGAEALTVNSTGTTTFGSAVGGTIALASLTTDAGGSTAINGGGVSTSGAQSYNDAVTLGADTTLTSTGAGAITFAATLDGAHSLSTSTTAQPPSPAPSAIPRHRAASPSLPARSRSAH